MIIMGKSIRHNWVKNSHVTIALPSQQQKADPAAISRMHRELLGQPIRTVPARTGPVDLVSQSMLSILCTRGHVCGVVAGGSICRRGAVPEVPVML